MTERKNDLTGTVSLRELRELRCSERAPEALRESLAARIEKELATAMRSGNDARVVAAQPATRSTPPAQLLPALERGEPRPAWRPEARSMALGFAAATALFALPQLRVDRARAERAAVGGDRSATEAREPALEAEAASSAGARLAESRSATPLQVASTARPAADTHASARSDSANRAFANGALADDTQPRKPAPEAPRAPAPTFSTETNEALAPALELLSDRPARSVVVPGFAPTAVAAPSDAGLPRAASQNLVTNGDFSQGTALWSVKRWALGAPPPTELAPFDVVDGALCSTIRGGDFVQGGWPEDRRLTPNSFELERDQRYRLSLKAWVRGPLPVALLIKVGHQYDPYTPALIASVPVTRAPHVFSVAFQPHADDDEAGIAFVASAIQSAQARLGSSDLCIDDVKLTREDGRKP